MLKAYNKSIKVSIHPPRVGRDQVTVAADDITIGFQSTLPVWGGTAGRPGEHDLGHVSIHPPRVGRDTPIIAARGGNVTFQSTLPVWGGTRGLLDFSLNA